MKYVVTLSAETKIAAIIDAENEDAAQDIALKLAADDKLDTLDEYVNPADFAETDWSSTVLNVETAESLGYGERHSHNVLP